MKKRNTTIGLICIIPWFFITSCKKLITIDGPETSVNSKDIYNNDATAVGALTSLYVNLSSAYLVASEEFSSLSCIAGLSADELSLFSGAGYEDLAVIYQNALTNTMNPGFWKGTYNKIYVVNSALEGLTNSTGLTPGIKKQLIGEAKFMRAFYYFYLVNLYGDVPLILGTDYKVNTMMSRTSKSLIYEQIIADLKEAQNLLSKQYLKGDGLTAYSNGAEERVRPTAWAASGLLARVYLYTKDWTNAEIQSSLVIESTSQYKLETLERTFLKNNRESIWQLQPVVQRNNTQDASVFLLPEEGPSSINPVYLSESLIGGFESGDLRKSQWINTVTVDNVIYYYSYKYRIPPTNTNNSPVNEYNTVLRLAEQFLIRAEARTELGNLSGAISDTDEIRVRAGLRAIKNINPNIDKEELLEEILKQRQLEFFTEWGHRWLDLKRTGKLDAVMTTITLEKGNTAGWKSYQQYYPILNSELNKSPNLIQTPGY